MSVRTLGYMHCVSMGYMSVRVLPAVEEYCTEVYEALEPKAYRMAQQPKISEKQQKK